MKKNLNLCITQGWKWSEHAQNITLYVFTHMFVRSFVRLAHVWSENVIRKTCVKEYINNTCTCNVWALLRVSGKGRVNGISLAGNEIHGRVKLFYFIFLFSRAFHAGTHHTFNVWDYGQYVTGRIAAARLFSTCHVVQRRGSATAAASVVARETTRSFYETYVIT